MTVILVSLVLVLIGVDQVLSRYTGGVPIYRSKALWAGVVTGVVVGVFWLAPSGSLRK